jgi:hypothetical protein
MPTFLHKPVRDGDTVARLIAAKAEENQHLDFKGGFWDDKRDRCKKCGETSVRASSAAEEVAKDVAAMANAEGGDLLVGVDDTDDRASGWWGGGGRAIPDDAEETVQLWLRNHIAPREAVDPVEIRRLSAKDPVDGALHSVLVITTPPWPYGPVAVQSHLNPQMARYSFPVRRGRDTIFRSVEEIMRLNDGQRRSIYLRLLDLVRSSDSPSKAAFQLRSGMHSRGGADLESRPLSSRDGSILNVTTEVLTLSIASTARLNGMGSIPQSNLTVPLEIVLAAWRDPDHPSLVALALISPVVWDGNKWNVSGGSR